MTAPQLNRLCRYWQKRLRLMDWQIRVERVSGLKEWGRNIADYNTRTSLIYVRDQDATPLGSFEDDSPSDRHFSLDEEEVLVHELVHLLATPFAKEETDTDGSLENHAEEFCINAISRALVAEHRGGI